MGWPWLFYIYGLLGYLWLAAWEPLVPNHTQETCRAATANASVFGHESTKVHSNSSSADASNSNRLDDGEVLAEKSARASTNEAVAAAGEGRGRYGTFISKGKSDGADTSPAAGEMGAGHKKLHLRDIPWMLFLRTPAFWALVISHSMFGVTYNIAMSWMPSYYNSAFGVDVKQSALMSVLPFAVMGLMTNAGGWIADGLVNYKILSTTWTRKLLQVLGTGTPAICLWYLSGAKHGSVTEAMLMLTLMLGGLGLQSGGFASTHQDICTQYAGLIFGLTNACSSLAGSVSVYMTGVVLDQTHNWGLVFGMVSFCNMCSLVAFVLLATSEPLFD